MAVRFVLGRAGSGKTAHCLEALAAAVRTCAPDGPAHILLVPEQASLQSERMLLAALQSGGTTVGSVYSFQRLVDLLLQDEPQGHMLSAAGRTMALQRLLGTQREHLRYFRGGRLLPGLHRQLGRQIDEFIKSAVEARALQPPDGASPTLQAKLHDLRLIYDAYRALLGRELVDPALRMDAARERLAEHPALRDARVWVDGFAGFTPQELRMLIGVAQRCASMDIALLADPPALDAPTAQRSALSPFAPIEETYDSLQRTLRAANIDIDPPLLLPHKRAVLPRFERAPDLAALEAGLFTDRAPYEGPAEHVHIYHAQDPDDEISWVVRHVIDLVSDERAALRYRDIAIITRRVEDRHVAISAALRRCSIPHYIDRRVPFSEHPLHAGVRLLLRAVSEKLSTDAMRALIKTPLARVAPADADLLENYLLAHRLAGPAAWRGRPWRRDPLLRSPLDERSGSERLTTTLLTRLNRLRERIERPLRPWRLDEGLPQRTVRAWAEALFDSLSAWRSARTLDKWIARAEDAGRVTDAARHREAWGALIELVDAVVDTLGDEHMTFAAFATTLEAGMNQLDIGLPPPAVDQLTVGSVERSRHTNIRAAFIIGFNDGTFPLPQDEPQLLNDADRSDLCAAGLDIQLPRHQRLADERLLAYITLTRAAQRVFISLSRRDPHGQALEPSPYLEDITRVLPSVCIDRGAEDPADAEQMARIVSLSDLSETLALRLSAAAHDGSCGDDPWLALYERVRQQPQWRDALRAAVQGLGNTPGCGTAHVARRAGAILQASATRLGSYAECPFKHFAAHVLRLQPRADGQLNALALGSFYHKLLEQFTDSLLENKQALADLDDDAIDAHLGRTIQQLMQGPAQAVVDAADRAPLARRAHWDLARALRIQRDQQRAGRCSTQASELRFGVEEQEAGASAVVIHTPKKRQLHLRGRIDRLDAAEGTGFVFDYKTGQAMRISMPGMVYGFDLQLLVYLLAVEVSGPASRAGRRLQPGGAFYLPLRPSWVDVDHPRQAGAAELKAYRPRGLFDCRFVEDLDQAAKSGKSRIIAYARNKDGSLSSAAGTDAWPPAAMTELLTRTRSLLGRLADDILDGTVEPAPYRLGGHSACTWCPFGSVCRIEPGSDAVRPLPDISRADLLNILQPPPAQEPNA